MTMAKKLDQSPIYVSRSEVGRLFQGLNRKTLANLSSEGRGPKAYRNGRKIFYKVSELEAWLTQNPMLTEDVR